MSLLRRSPRPPQRALTAAAQPFKVTSQADIAAARQLRQNWQTSAWVYRDEVPEIRYVVSFLGQAISRIRLYPAAHDPEAGEPAHVDDAQGLPAGVAAAAQQALDELGSGALGHAAILKAMAECFEIAGEGSLLGDDTSPTPWTFKSTDELVVTGEGFGLRTLPGSNGSNAGVTPLAEGTYVARMWRPHPRFSQLADSPMRALLQSCEELCVLSRSILATARSRLATAGVLGVSTGLSLQTAVTAGQDDDPEADPFFGQFTQAMITPIADESNPAGVVPIIIRGPVDELDKGLKYVPFPRAFDAEASKTRQELIGRLANGLNIPREILTGVADMNHWGAWQVDDATFRYHIEPLVLQIIDALTVGYLRPALIAAGVPQAVAERCVVWYDPTELVTHPDRTADAILLYDRFALSDATLRKVAGWEEEDKPPAEEFLLRLLGKERTFPPNIVEALFHRFDPTLPIPADPVLGLPPESGGQPAPIAQAPPNPGPPPGGSPSGPSVPSGSPPAITAASTRLTSSDRLVRIDRDLRATVHAAADAAMARALERAGNRARGKMPNAEKPKLSGVDPERMCATIGRADVLSYGLDEETLLAGEWARLKSQFAKWVKAAYTAARKAAAAMTRQPAPPVESEQEQVDAGWAWLETALAARAAYLLYHPPTGDQPDEQPVPVGLVRAALAIAGGYDAPAGITPEGMPVDPSRPLTGVATGPVVTAPIRDAGGTVAEYQWVHGNPEYPFEPHLALDGYTFGSFADSRLAAAAGDSSWLGVGGYFPGDHRNCQCDVMPLWHIPDATQAGYGLAASGTTRRDHG